MEVFHDRSANSRLHEAPRVVAAQGKQGQLPALRIAEQGAIPPGYERPVQALRRTGVRAEDRKVKLVNPGPEHILNKYFLDPAKWLHPATMQRYVRADLYEKARAENKRLKELIKLLED
mgnify:CR=1 FL=1